MSTSLNLDQSISLLNCDACQVRPYSNSLAFGQLDVSDTRQPCKHAGALMANWLQTLKIDSQPLATGQLDISDNCQLYKARPQYGYNHHNSQLIITSTGSAPVWSRRRRPYLSLADVPAIRLPPLHTHRAQLFVFIFNVGLIVITHRAKGHNQTEDVHTVHRRCFFLARHLIRTVDCYTRLFSAATKATNQHSQTKGVQRRYGRSLLGND